MANNKMVVEERARDLGGFLVGRLLPFRQKRQVGPFTFIDHMGPVDLGKGKHFDVDQHPHIGLCTLTYLFHGSVEHKDSTGVTQEIHPGDVGLMTAGKGVAHTERTPASLRNEDLYSMHGYQVWIALPKDKEEIEPRFDFVKKSALPSWEHMGIRMTLVAGHAFGRTSPLPTYSPLFMVDMYATRTSKINISGEVKGEIAIVVTQGRVRTEDQIINAGQMLISKTDDECCFEAEINTRLLLFGGEPLPEERFMYWNFVSSSKERIEQAKSDWANKKFPKVPGDDTYIPLPAKR